MKSGITTDVIHSRTLILAAALGAIFQSAAALTVPATTGVRVEQLTPQRVHLQLVDAYAVGPVQLVLESAGARLIACDTAGREFSPVAREISRQRDSRRMGLSMPADVLREGVTLREEGLLPDSRSLVGPLSAVDADEWAPYAFLRIEVAETGMYRITREWLSDSLRDFDVDLQSDTRNWTLVHNDVPVPIWFEGGDDGVFDSQDAIVFWAEYTQVEMEDRGPDTWMDPWTSLETYMLCYRAGYPGVRMAQESGELVSTNPDDYVTPVSFPDTRHYEENTYVSRLTRVFGDTQPDNESWGSGIYAGELRNFQFQTPGLDRTSSLSPKLRVCLRGFSASAYSAEYEIIQRAQIYLNNLGGESMEVGAAGDWGNQALRIVEFGEETFSDHTELESLNNVVRIACLDQAPADDRSAVVLNWFELTYQHKYVATDDELVFGAGDELDNQLVYFDLQGFSNEHVDLYKLGSSSFRNHLIRRDDQGWRVRFQDVYSRDTRYIALGDDAYHTPFRVRPAEVHDLAGNLGGAAYLIVLCDTLYRAGGADVLQPLVDHLEQTVGNVLLVSDRWIYDEFSSGRYRPHGIRRLLQTAWLRWNEAPEYLLMIGSGSLQQRFSAEEEAPTLPIYYSQMRNWGAASIDDWYTRTSAGHWLGTMPARWPAENLEELQNMVDKVLAYDAQTSAAWNNSLLMVAGAKAVDEGAFQAHMEELIRYHLPHRFFIRRIEAGETGVRYIGGRQELLDFLAQGQVLVNYHGHGGSDVWYDNDLLRGEDVALMTNEDRLPFVTNVTCFIVSPEPEETLGRNLLNTGQMGAIGVMGSTAVTFQEAGSELGNYFYDYITNNPELSVGQALRLAKERMFLLYVNGSSEEQTAAEAAADMMAILGLPSQQLHLSHESPLVVALDPPVVRQGAGFVIQGTTNGSSMELQAELYSEYADPYQTSEDYVNDVYRVSGSAQGSQGWSLEVETPSSLFRGGTPASARVVMVTTDGVEASAAEFFFADSLSSLYLWDAAFIPETPRPGDTASFRVRAAAPADIDSLVMHTMLYHVNGDSIGMSTRLGLIQQNPDDATLYGSEAILGPLQEDDLLKVELVTHWGGQSQEGVPIYLPVEVAAPSLQVSSLGYGRDFDGAIALQIDNVGDADCANGDATLVIRNQNGDVIQREILPTIAAGAREQRRLLLHAGILGDSLNFALEPAELLDGLSGLPETLVLNELFISLADTLLQGNRPVTQHIDLERPAAPGALLAVRLVDDASLLEHQPGLEQIGSAVAWEWVHGEDEFVNGVYHVDGLDSLRLANLSLLSLSSRADFLVSHLQGSASLSSQTEDALRFDFQLKGGGVGAGWFYDEEAPTLELQIENQIYSPGGFVPREPSFSLILTDRNGIDEGNGLTLSFDDVVVDAADVAFQENSNPGRMVLRVTPDTYGADTDSLHTLAVSSADAAGNRAEAEYQFYLSDDFRLEYIGNYPNPFQRETRFVFKLTGVATRASIELFTISGRPIRTLRVDGPIIDYNELMWDGRDQRGDLVANGVYFYRFVAHREGGQIEYVGKMAKLK